MAILVQNKAHAIKSDENTGSKRVIDVQLYASGASVRR